MAPARPLAALALALALAGCSLTQNVVDKVREMSLGDRCAYFMQEAFPGGDIEVTRQSTPPVDTQSIATVVIAVEGTRKKLPADGKPSRDVAVECRFDEGILTGFRWTKGPLRGS